MGEDLTNWKPKINHEYNGFDYHKHGKHLRGYTIIYYKKPDNSLEEHYGGYNIINNQTKIWYMDSNNQKVQKFIPVSQCEFRKTRQGDKTYYHLFVEASVGGNNMSNRDGKNMDDTNYGERKNQDEKVHIGVKKEDAKLIDRLLGKTSAIYNKNQAEEKLNELWKSFDYTIEDINTQEKELEHARVQIPALSNTVTSTEKEWSESLKSLGNLINKKTTHEKGMWALTQSTRQNRDMKIKQKFHKSDVDEMNFNSMMDYIKQYPELQSARDIDRGAQALDTKREAMLKEQRVFEEAKLKYNYVLNTFESLTEKAEAYINEFESYIGEAEEKVNNSRYNKNTLIGKLRILQTELEQQSTRLNMLPYRGKLQERKAVLKRIKDKLSLFKRKKWEDIEQ